MLSKEQIAIELQETAEELAKLAENLATIELRRADSVRKVAQAYSDGDLPKQLSDEIDKIRHDWMQAYCDMASIDRRLVFWIDECRKARGEQPVRPVHPDYRRLLEDLDAGNDE